MSFNPDPTKPPVELIFSTRTNPPTHPPLHFNGAMLKTVDEHKHIGLILDKKLTFCSHVKSKIDKAKSGVSVIKFMSRYAPRKSLEQIYVSYVRSHLEYGDVIFHQPPKNGDPLSHDLTDLMNKLESVQYSASLAVSGAWRGTSKSKVYNELGWEYLSERRWFRGMCLFYKIVNNQTPAFLRECIALLPPPPLSAYGLPLAVAPPDNAFIPFEARTDKFNNSFFPASVRSWNNMSDDNRNSNNLDVFKKNILGFFKPKRKEMYGLLDIYLLTLLRVELNQLRYYKFVHNFVDTDDAMCIAKTELRTMNTSY